MTFHFVPSQWTTHFGEFTVWHEYSGLARQCGSINLGQGFPGWLPPEFTMNAFKTAAGGGVDIQQYAPPAGNMRLIEALCKLYSPLVGIQLNSNQFQISAGASGGLWLATQAIIEPGDHAILIAPFFDIYEGDVIARGGKVVEVPLHMPSGAKTTKEYKLDLEKLKEEVLKSQTKVLILNTPHNPTGKVFSRKELEDIADIVKLNPRLVVITDEVYEFMTYDDVKFERFCTIPGMWERTINISSGGKFFSSTGWKIGWVYGPENLLKNIKTVNNYVSFATNNPLQFASALSIENCLQEPIYFDKLKAHYAELRQYLFETLEEIGLNPVKPEGTFFIDCDISDISMEKDQGTHKTLTKMNLDLKDWNFCRWLTTEVGVAAIPCSAFYTGSRGPSQTVRFAFCKPMEQLQEARKRLLVLKSMLKKT